LTAAQPSYAARDPAALSRAVIFWLCAHIVATLVTLIATIIDLGALTALAPQTPIDISAPPPGSNGFVDSFAAISLLVAIVGAGFLSLKWVYRVSLNAHVLGRGLRVRPPWAVGWFFVPIASLWKPFQGLREAWQASVRPQAWSTVPVPSLLRWWWGLWLVEGFLQNLSLRLELRAKTADQMITADIASLAANLMALPLDLAFIFIVRRLCELQLNALRTNAFA